MISQELKTIKKIKKGDRKKILLINPKRKGVSHFIPHNGLATLAAILRARDHEVLVVDYAFIHDKKNIFYFIKKFKPTVIGISAYTVNLKAVNEIIFEVNRIAHSTPLIVGGPHATLYDEFLAKDKRIDYLVKGEAELIILDLVENAKKEDKCILIESKEIVNLEDIPFPDFTVFYKWKSLRNYPILTSRGCPFRCSFCSVCSFAYNRWRARSPENCIKELESAKDIISPNLTVVVCDDAPTTDKKRFNNFLDLYSKKIKLEISIINIRADSVDDKFLIALKKCGGDFVSLGIEHAHPEVFKLVNKGETLKQIEDAAKLVKKYNMKLGLSFIIGLPNDNLERIKASIDFAKRVKGDSCGWNFVAPYKGSAVADWFEKNGKIYNLFDYNTRVNSDFTCEEPCTETPDFTREERKKAHFMCLFETITYECNFRNIFGALNVAIKYRLYPEFFYWLPKGIIKNLKGKIDLVRSAILDYKNEGIIYVFKKTKRILNSKLN
jgi:radical SAM superfamily enzyme YgiQ (UPF0313 family)